MACLTSKLEGYQKEIAAAKEALASAKLGEAPYKKTKAGDTGRTNFSNLSNKTVRCEKESRQRKKIAKTTSSSSASSTDLYATAIGPAAKELAERQAKVAAAREERAKAKETKLKEQATKRQQQLEALQQSASEKEAAHRARAATEMRRASRVKAAHRAEAEAARQLIIAQKAEQKTLEREAREAEAALKERERAFEVKAKAVKRQAARDEREEATARARLDADDVHGMKRFEQKRRRDSLAYRVADAGRIAVLVEGDKHDELSAHRSLSETARHGAEDTTTMKRRTSSRKRESLAFRGGEANRIASLDAETRKGGVAAAQEAAEYARMDAHDVSDLNKAQARRKRESLAFRGAEARRIADLEKERAVAWREERAQSSGQHFAATMKSAFLEEEEEQEEEEEDQESSDVAALAAVEFGRVQQMAFAVKVQQRAAAISTEAEVVTAEELGVDDARVSEAADTEVAPAKETETKTRECELADSTFEETMTEAIPTFEVEREAELQKDYEVE
mmetsp:Transcript_89083/g.172559  ORF Transcript_89083/g.172559 Transcript_89083/m.172559 type:complete len:509 (-) Transcript_89083:156-1682(-)|eukprot:CAMPEP_0171755562 /NCGR_PEP_ID=MMETSP0991-20121206/44534_1 /TAXON_ID=483369 /ORGANISM="non described non described, Strain CCMP2098" /LENGTH=508 /DNA_ID=CAMNT_0012357657 /DNA_START=97 /DNA_END=1623 /DNA_ORIENTATION=-